MRRRSWPAVAAVTLALASVNLLAGCDNPRANVQNCVSVRPEVVHAVARKLATPGKLRNAKMVVNGGYSFVSAELLRPTDDKHTKGDLLTWASRDTKGSGFVSVDVHAREASSWPHASFDVRQRGAIESRACSGLSRGKTPAQLACEHEQSTGGFTLPNGKGCGDL